MSRKKLAVAVGMLVVSCLTAVVYAQDAQSGDATLAGKLEQLRRNFLSPRASTDDSRSGWSQRESYSERHRQRIEATSEPAARTAALPFGSQLFQRSQPPESTGQAGEQRILDETRHGVVERLKEEPSKELEAAMRAVPAAPVVDRGTASTPIHGIPRRVAPRGAAPPVAEAGSFDRENAPDTTNSGRAILRSDEPQRFDAPIRRLAPENVTREANHTPPVRSAAVDEELVEQRRELRSARRTIPTPSAARTPVVDRAVEPRVEEESEPATAGEPQRAVESPPREVADSFASDESVLFTNKSPILNVQTMGPRATVMGREAVYKVRVQNLGGAEAAGVTVHVQIPAWAEITAMEPSCGTTRTATSDASEHIVQWEVGSLAAESHEVLSLKLVPRKNQSFDLSVHWSFAPIKTETMIEVQEPKLRLELTGPKDVLFGETKIYRLSISNPGTGSAENVEIQLLPIDGDADIAASQNIGTLAPGEERALEIELTARQAGTVTMRANAVAEGGLRADAAEQILVRRAELQIEAIGPQDKFAGTPARYRLRLSNPGNAPAEEVQVFAVLPAGAEYTTASSGGKLDEATRRVEWSIGSLQAGEERIVEVQCVLNTPGDNSLRVGATAAADLAQAASVATHVQAVADLKLEVTDPDGPVPTGEDSVYQVRIINRGTKSAKNIDVVAFFSEGIEPTNVLGAPHDVGPGQVTFRPIASLPAGGEVLLKIVAKAEIGGNHVFRTEVRCQDNGARLAAEQSTLYYESGNASPIGSSTAAPRQATTAPNVEGDAPQTLPQQETPTDRNAAAELAPPASDLGDRY
ncbi:MAG: CARDB domain-containing protein [Pirellulales bacterium]